MKPLRFQPLLKQVIWGGDKIVALKGIQTDLKQVGESWEISGVDGSQTVVAEGEYKGLPLNELVSRMKGKLLGEENYRRFGNEFPLLIKFIDAHRDLSIQVHPDDETAKRQGRGRGKTEMWYIMRSDDGASLYNGLAQRLTPQQYEEMVENGTICDALARYQVTEGDAFFIPAGRIHSIGTGCFLAEIQQTSDVTYRIFDYNRRDAEGRLRQLHVQEAAECIDYNVASDYRISYAPKKNQRVKLVATPHFTTSLYDVDDTTVLDYSDLDSFVILVGLNGSATFTDDQGDAFTLSAGQTVLLPATARRLSVSPGLRFLECYV